MPKQDVDLDQSIHTHQEKTHLPFAYANCKIPLCTYPCHVVAEEKIAGLAWKEADAPPASVGYMLRAMVAFIIKMPCSSHMHEDFHALQLVEQSISSSCD